MSPAAFREWYAKFRGGHQDVADKAAALHDVERAQIDLVSQHEIPVNPRVRGCLSLFGLFAEPVDKADDNGDFNLPVYNP